MTTLRWIRVAGFVLIILGFGSAYMRTQLDIDTVLTAWMGAAQPWAGIAMGVVGIALVVAGMIVASRKASGD